MYIFFSEKKMSDGMKPNESTEILVDFDPQQVYTTDFRRIWSLFANLSFITFASMDIQQFKNVLQPGYTFAGGKILLGAAVFDGHIVKEVPISIPLVTMNRHGLIAGATGTGKTKTLQLLAEQLSSAGVPVLMMDIKGDLSGIAKAGTANEKINDRHTQLGIGFTPHDNPVQFLTLSGEKGARLRATISEFGPVLFGKILELNDTQQSVVTILFKYADDKELPLLDLKDMKKLLQYATEEGKEEITAEYGKISTATTGIVLRKIIELEQQGAEVFFGERSFEVEDLLRLDETGKGYINLVRLTDIQDKPKLFSTFMLCLLAEVYSSFEEQGDADQPKLVIFIDEAHLIFDEASKALLNQIETIIKLIRSKGVGVYFCTQNPTDIPDAVLSQLGLKIQHALRAFTAKDRKAIQLAAENYPLTDFYKVEDLIMNLGIGEAFVTALNEKGIPTPLAHTMLQAPASRMDVLTPLEIDQINALSFLVKKYNEVVDRESAYEMLTGKLKSLQEPVKEEKTKTTKTKTTNKEAGEDGIGDTLGKVANSGVGKMVVKEVTRGLLGVIGLGGRRKKRSGWF
jgi:DNA helicase HerA-like ATPase